MKSKNLWVIGLIVVLVGSLLNGILIRGGIGGVIRELMRLVILAGVFLLIFGLIRRSKK